MTPGLFLLVSNAMAEPASIGYLQFLFFTVLECPSEDYLDSLLNNEVFRKHQITATCDEDLAHTVVHFSPPEIIQHPR